MIDTNIMIFKSLLEISEWIYSKQGRQISVEVHSKKFFDLVYRDSPYFVANNKEEIQNETK